MEKKIFKLSFISAVIATLGEVAFLLYVSGIYSTLNWQLIVGSLLLITGMLLLFNVCLLKETTFKNKILLFYAIIFNPILVSIFAGIVALTAQYRVWRVVYYASGAAMVLCIVIGFAMVTITFRRSRVLK